MDLKIVFSLITMIFATLTVSLGIAMVKGKRQVLKFHKASAFLTLTFSIISFLWILLR